MAKKKAARKKHGGVTTREVTAGRRRRVREYTGKRQCQRCRKRDAEFRVVIEGDPRFLCRMCKDVVDYQPPELMIHDHERTEWTIEAEKFIDARLESLRAAILDSPLRALYIALRHSNMKVGAVVVKPHIQARPKGAPRGWRPWMSVEVSVRRTHRYPFVERVRTGSVAVREEERNLIGQEWFFEYEEVAFNDPAEVFVYGAGQGLFKVLRKLKLVPGRASKVGMRAHGLEWLREFRESRAGWDVNPEALTTFQVAG